MAGCVKQSAKPPIEGAWKLIYMKGPTDSIVYEFPGNLSGSQAKMWAGNHFTVVGKLLIDTLTYYNYVMGTFTLEGEKYTENIEIHTSPEYAGKTINLKLVIKNDTLTQIWPLNDEGEPVENANIEKYVRFD